MSDIYSTNQMAEMLSTTAATVRSYKSRHKDQLVEGTHWINQDGQTLWTNAGLEALQLLKGASPTEADLPRLEMQEEETSAAEDNQHDILKRYIPLVESVASAVADRLLGRIDRAVSNKIGTAIATPMTATECITVLQSLGLKPCDPTLLLNANNQNLLPESKEN
ncbi:MAG TPA: hypothetical protein V6D15_08465 [Oculatellaceae cyanobacterium]|jgi:hypothetical protein